MRAHGTFNVNFTGMSGPMGICGDTYNVFVAESYGASIMVVDKSNLQISHITLETNSTFLCEACCPSAVKQRQVQAFARIRSVNLL